MCILSKLKIMSTYLKQERIPNVSENELRIGILMLAKCTYCSIAVTYSKFQSNFKNAKLFLLFSFLSYIYIYIYFKMCTIYYN